MRIRNLNSALFLCAATGLAAVCLPGTAAAKPIKGNALGYALEQCLLANDSQTGESATKFGCCSHEAGICVICPQPPSYNNVCQVTPYRTNGLPGTHAAGAEINNQMMKLKRGK